MLLWRLGVFGIRSYLSDVWGVEVILSRSSSMQDYIRFSMLLLDYYVSGKTHCLDSRTSCSLFEITCLKVVHSSC